MPRRIRSDHVGPEHQSRRARAQPFSTPGFQLLRRGPVPQRTGTHLPALARATSGTNWPCRRWATTWRWRRKAKAGPWCARRAGVELVSNVCRHRQAVMLQGARPHAPEHRLPAAPLDLRPARPAGRRAAFRRGPLPEPAQLPGAELARLVVRGQRSRRRDRPGRARPRGRTRLQRLRVRPCHPARVRLQLEDLHRGLPGGLPRRPVPPRAGPLRDLRRPALGIRPPPLGADGRREPGAGEGRLAGLPALARRAAGASAAARRRRTAPSG